MADISSEAIESCQKTIEYKFKDLSLLKVALTHSSVANTRAESNERMEFLGDVVLGLSVCHELYDDPDELLEGEMTKIKSSVVSRQTCCDVCEKLGVTKYLVVGKGIRGHNGVMPMSVSAAFLESLIGAIYLDGGLEPAKKFVLKQMRPPIDEALANQHKKNFKSLLQQFAQKSWSQTPEYELLDEKGPEHSKCFEIAVSIEGRHFPSAWGMNKKQAEQEAARRALSELGILEE